MVDVENFQSLSMAEKLRLWKLKAGKTSGIIGIAPASLQQNAQPQQQSTCDGTGARAPEFGGVESEVVTSKTFSSADVSDVVLGDKKETGKRRDSIGLSADLLLDDREVLDSRSESSSRTSICMTRGKGGAKKSKRKSLWGCLPASPLMIGLADMSPSQTQRPRTSPCVRTLLNKSPCSAFEDQNANPNIIVDENVVNKAKSRRSLDESLSVAGIDDIFGFGLSPLSRKSYEKINTPGSQTSKAGARKTPTLLQTRDSVGYYTANESIDQSITDESKDYIEFACSSGRISLENNAGERRVSTATRSSKSRTQIASLESSLEAAMMEINSLKSDLSGLIKDKMILSVKVHSLEEQKKEAEAKAEAHAHDVQAQTFLNSVLEQKNEELSHQISSDRLNRNEDMASAAKKYKAQIEKMTNERKMYEERANAMCAEMGEQMSLLQSTAMGRIETLEGELFEERRKFEALEAELRQAKASAALTKVINVSKGGRKSYSSDSSGNSEDTVKREDEEDEEEDDEEEASSTPEKKK